MFGKSVPRPPTGTPIGRRQSALLDTVEQLSRTRGGRGTTWTPGGPFSAPVPGPKLIGYAQPSGVIAKATGTFPDLTAGTGTGDVYVNVSGNLVQVASGVTLYNWGTDDTTAGYRLIVESNGDSSFDIIGQFCSAP